MDSENLKFGDNTHVLAVSVGSTLNEADSTLISINDEIRPAFIDSNDFIGYICIRMINYNGLPGPKIDHHADSYYNHHLNKNHNNDLDKESTSYIKSSSKRFFNFKHKNNQQPQQELNTDNNDDHTLEELNKIRPSNNIPLSNYFTGRNRRYSIMLQGRFKKEFQSDDIYFGFDFDQKVRTPIGSNVAIKIAKWLDPSLEVDLNINNPYVYSPLVTAMNSLSVYPLYSNVLKLGDPFADENVIYCIKHSNKQEQEEQEEQEEQDKNDINSNQLNNQLINNKYHDLYKYKTKLINDSNNNNLDLTLNLRKQLSNFSFGLFGGNSNSNNSSNSSNKINDNKDTQIKDTETEEEKEKNNQDIPIIHINEENLPYLLGPTEPYFDSHYNLSPLDDINKKSINLNDYINKNNNNNNHSIDDWYIGRWAFGSTMIPENTKLLFYPHVLNDNLFKRSLLEKQLLLNNLIKHKKQDNEKDEEEEDNKLIDNFIHDCTGHIPKCKINLNNNKEIIHEITNQDIKLEKELNEFNKDIEKQNSILIKNDEKDTLLPNYDNNKEDFTCNCNDCKNIISKINNNNNNNNLTKQEINKLLPNSYEKRKKFFSKDISKDKDKDKLIYLKNDRIYCMDFYDAYFDMQSLLLKLPGLNLDIKKYWDGQPLRFICKSKSTNQILFTIWFQFIHKNNINEFIQSKSKSQSKS